MFKPGMSLTNTRPPKSSEPEITLTPTEGNVKLNQPAALLLGVKDDDFVGINIGDEMDENNQPTGNKLAAIFVGYGAEITEDGEGKKKVTKSAMGAKLSTASAKGGGGNLQFSSVNSWKEMGGTTKERKVFAIVPDSKVVYDGIPYWVMKFVRTEEKMERETKDTATNVAANS